jgi:hypothetical protein
MRRCIVGQAQSYLFLAVLTIFLFVASAKASDGSNKTASLGEKPPADIDEQVPPVRSDVPCPMAQLLHETGMRAQELVDNLQKFSATDRVDDVEQHKKERRAITSTYNYVAEIKHYPNGPSIEEYRESTSQNLTSQMHFNDLGTAAFALIFHPRFIQDYIVTCEGLGEWQGQTAWQLRFAQHPEHGNAFHVYRVPGGNVYPARLKGRAWISTDKFEVFRIETDLLLPIPQIYVEREHLIVEYGPVDFKKHGVQFWLPQMAELFIRQRGHRYHRRHTFSNYQLFSVETTQQIKQPKSPDDSPQN